MVNERTLMIAAAAVATTFVLYLITRGAGKVGEDIGGAVVDLADGAVTGVVTGIGERFGIPLTDAEKALQARRNGDVWEASKYMPAGEFLAWLAAGKPTN